MNGNAHAANVLNMLSSMIEVKNKPSVQAQLEKAKAEAAALRAEAAKARESAAAERDRLLRSKRDGKVRLRVTAVVMMTAALIRIGWEATRTAEPPVTATVAGALPGSTHGVTAVNLSLKKTADGPTDDNSVGGKALERIRTAFHSFPELDQAEVVKEVNKRFPGEEMTCPITWQGGRPILSVGDSQGVGPPSVGDALNRCASGIERLRAEKDAQQAAN